MKAEDFDIIKDKISKGGLIYLTGIGLTFSQVEEIRKILDKRKSGIDDYFNSYILTRLIK